MIAACTSLLLCFSCAFGVSCNKKGGKDDSQNQSANSSLPSGSDSFSAPDGSSEAEKPLNSDSSAETPPQTSDSASESTPNPDNPCENGHDYTYNDGLCECGDELILPALPSQIVNASPDGGNGDPYPNSEIENSGRYECRAGEDGIYSFTIPETPNSDGLHEIWLSFRFFETAGPGQYALQTLERSESIQIARYDASASFIPSYGDEARALEDGNLCSVVNISKKYLSTAEDYFGLRATFCISGNPGDTVKLRFFRAAEPVWEPGTLYIDVIPEQINGVKAPEGDVGKVLTEVPYSTKYFYDESCGYYRMGTEANPGEIIYAAITKATERQLQGASFTMIQYEGNALTLGGELTEDGQNYSVYNYVPFIYNNNAEIYYTEQGEALPVQGDPTKNCYQNFVNSDGVYPVNQELFTFLSRYVKKHGTVEGPTPQYAANAWLAACFYYKQIPLGENGNPHVVTQLGAISVTTPKAKQVYYKLLWSPTPDENNPNALLLPYVRLRSTDSNAGVYVNDVFYGGQFDLLLEINDTTGLDVRFAANNPRADATFEVILEAVTAQTLDASATTLSTQEYHMLDGTVSHQAYYVYKATQNGTLTLTSDSADTLLLGDQSLVNGTATISVSEKEEIIVYLSATTATTANITFTFTP